MRKRHALACGRLVTASFTFALLGAIVPFASPALAQDQPFYHPRPAPSTFAVRKDVTYTGSAGASVAMDVYRPAKIADHARLPAILFLNTNAGRSQRAVGINVGWAEATTARGMVAILPDAAADFAAGLDSLLAYVRSHATELSVDPERVAVYVASGNAFTALPVIEDPKRTAIAAAVVYYGGARVTSFRSDLPVLFVRAGLDRPGMNEALDALVAQATKENAPVQMINYPSGHHAFEMRDDTEATRDVIDRTFDFVAAATDPRQRAALRAGSAAARAGGAASTGDFATAVRLYAELVATHPDDVNLRLAYGEALLGAGRAREARTQFDQLKDKGLGFRDLGLPAARAALADGDPDSAIAWLRTIPKRFLPRELASDPDFEALQERADFRALFE